MIFVGILGILVVVAARLWLVGAVIVLRVGVALQILAAVVGTAHSLDRALGQASHPNHVRHRNHGVVGAQGVLRDSRRGRLDPAAGVPRKRRTLRTRIASRAALLIRAGLKHPPQVGGTCSGEAGIEFGNALVSGVFGLQRAIARQRLRERGSASGIAVRHSPTPLALSASIAYDRARAPTNLSMICALVVNRDGGYDRSCARNRVLRQIDNKEALISLKKAAVAQG